jgi:hypothetical protein
MEPARFDLLKDVALALPDPMRKIRGIPGAQLWTDTTAAPVPPAAIIVMTPPSKRVHIMEGPYNWRVLRHSGKECLIVDKARNPMQMNHITGGELVHYSDPMLRAIITEKLIACGLGHAITQETPSDLLPAQPAA